MRFGVRSLDHPPPRHMLQDVGMDFAIEADNPVSFISQKAWLALSCNTCFIRWLMILSRVGIGESHQPTEAVADRQHSETTSNFSFSSEITKNVTMVLSQRSDQFHRDNTICGCSELFGLITCNEIEELTADRWCLMNCMRIGFMARGTR